MSLVFEMHEVNPGVSNISGERWRDGQWVRKTEKAVVRGLLPSSHTRKQTQNNYTSWLRHSLTYRCEVGSQETKHLECFGTKATFI